MSSFKLDTEKIKRLVAERGWNMARLASACDFHPSTLTRAITKGEPASLETLLNIADKLGVKNHLSLVEGYVEPTPIPIAMKLAAPPELSDILTPDQWEAILKYVVSSIATFIITSVQKGSLIVTIMADDAALQDLLNSFLAWRLQYIGAYEIRVTTPIDERQYISDLFLSHFSFPTSAMYDRCAAAISSQRSTKVATQQGLQIAQRNPPDILFTSREVDAAWQASCVAKKTAQLAWEYSRIPGVHAPFLGADSNKAWTDARAAALDAAEAWAKAANTATSDAIEHAARNAHHAAHHAVSTAFKASHTYSYPPSGWHSPKAVEQAVQTHLNNAIVIWEEAWRYALAAWDASRAVLECAPPPWEQPSDDKYDVWRFHSTLLSSHIQEAERCWSKAPQALPSQAQFPKSDQINVQPGILFDDETFLNQPQHEFS